LWWRSTAEMGGPPVRRWIPALLTQKPPPLPRSSRRAALPARPVSTPVPSGPNARVLAYSTSPNPHVLASANRDTNGRRLHPGTRAYRPGTNTAHGARWGAEHGLAGPTFSTKSDCARPDRPAHRPALFTPRGSAGQLRPSINKVLASCQRVDPEWVALGRAGPVAGTPRGPPCPGNSTSGATGFRPSWPRIASVI